MTKMIQTACLLTITAAVLSPLSAQSLQEITQEHHGAMLADLVEYIEANPEAADVNEAVSKAIESAYYAENKPAMLELLQNQFDNLKSQTPLPSQELAQTGMMLAQFSMETGNTDNVKSVQAAFAELAESSGDPIMQQVSSMLQDMLSKPGIGTDLDFSGTTLEGKEISLDDYEGKVVLVDFWATWCGPCIAELPGLKEAYAKYHDKGFEVVGISLDENVDTLKKFIAENGINWVNLFDQDQASSLAEQYSITTIPSLFLLDKTGKVVALDPRGDTLETELEKLLGD
ncbi:MAG: TlpA disulfide reductase family protein [Kiritimatiellia bacterium]